VFNLLSRSSARNTAGRTAAKDDEQMCNEIISVWHAEHALDISVEVNSVPPRMACINGSAQGLQEQPGVFS
jgi:hypothetical protein